MGLRGPKAPSDSIKDAAIVFYKQPNSAKATAKQFGMSYGGMRKLLKRNGVLREFEYGSGPKEIVDSILAMWAQGMSQSRIGIAVGMGQTKIGKILKKNGIMPVERRGRQNNGCYKGGRWEHDGYIKILLDYDDPLMPMSDAACTVLEHRLVMARYLGRMLLPSETVHHIDGNGKNNDISNLQLRQGLHGKGVKMCCKDCGSFNVVPVPLD